MSDLAERSAAPGRRTSESARANRRRRAVRRKRVVVRALSALSRVSTRLAAVWAESLFRTPPRQHPTRRERRVLDTGSSDRVWIGRRSLAVRRFGAGTPAILLVHGWGGHGGRLSAFVGPLRRAGFSVVAFDAPAHGSSPGRRASLPDFARAILAVDRALGPFAGVVAHSMGAAGAALAMREGFAPGRAVFLAPPADPEEFTRRFARALKMSRTVEAAMSARLERRYATRWREVKLIACAPRAPVPLLIFHDRRDAAVPLREARAILLAWRDAAIVHTRGLGHHKILRDPSVVGGALAFLRRDPASEATPAGA